MPEVKSCFEPQGAFLVSNSPEQFDQILKNDAQRYAGLFKEFELAQQVPALELLDDLERDGNERPTHHACRRA